jgi:DNA-binding NtrC family response regulator
MSVALSFEVIPLSEVPSQATISGSEMMRRPMVLIVDDERIIADTLSIILSRSGFAVMTAYNGRSALEMAELVPPELLLSDVVMEPDMDGAQLAVAVLRRCPDCKVLLFSGHASTVDLLVRSRELGHNFTLLTKPVHPADLLRRITQSLSLPELAALTA